MSNDLLCDFCAKPNPAHVIPCLTFEVDTPVANSIQPMVSTGDWLACDECNAIVNQGDQEGLLQRAKQEFIKKYDWWSDFAEDELRGLHKQFWEARIVVGGKN